MTDQQPEARAVCDHFYASHCYRGMSVRLCMMCHEPDWDDLARQLAGAAETASAAPGSRSPVTGPRDPAAAIVDRAEPIPEVVCLCGSTRFREAFERAGRTETLRGAIVLTVNDFDAYGGPERGQQDVPSREKAAADELHRRKIDLADRVLVVSEGGYFGDSTRGEIEYAVAHGKPVTFTEPAAEKRARDAGLIPEAVRD